jgi:ribose-phosphate pyrophosphokinase
MVASKGIMLFALDTSREYGARLAARLELPLSAQEERAFEDGEHKARPLVDPHSRDVFVLHSLYGEPGRSPNDKLCRLLFFIGALKDAGAARVTAIAPYLCYARKDRRTQPNDPITTKYVARLFEAAGADAVMTLDVHNLAAYENAFRVPALNIEAIPIFVEHFGQLCRGRPVAVISPDIGGTKRADLFRRALGAALHEEPAAGFADKRRSGGIVSGDMLVGDIRDRDVILFDDLISTGTTLRRAAKLCREAGARRVYAAATHGLLMDDAPQALPAVLDGIAVADTVPPASGVLPPHFSILDSSSLVAAAINAAHARG